MTLFNLRQSMTLLLTLDVNKLMIDERNLFLYECNQMLITFAGVNKLSAYLK